MVTKLRANAKESGENNFASKRLLEYDDVMNIQREYIKSENMHFGGID